MGQDDKKPRHESQNLLDLSWNTMQETKKDKEDLFSVIRKKVDKNNTMDTKE